VYKSGKGYHLRICGFHVIVKPNTHAIPGISQTENRNSILNRYRLHFFIIGSFVVAPTLADLSNIV